MPGATIGTSIFFVIWLVMVLGGFAGCIVFLVAVWRLMRAHESLSQRVGGLVDALRSRQM